MKKVCFMLAMMVCIFASCSDGGGEEPSTPTPKPEEVKTEITIDSGIISNGLSFDSTGGEQSVSFSVNADWTLSIASTTSGATWCKASVTSGSKGTTNVKFTVSENTDYEDRSVSVTIKARTVSKTFTITQKGADAMLVTTTKYEVAQEGGQIEIEVKANIDYRMEISEEAKEWIKESSGRALTTYKHKLDIAMNEDTKKREGEITFKSGNKVETVKVYQAGGAILLLSQNEYTVSDAGETISVDIKSNIDFGVQMPNVDWIIDEASSRGLSSHTLKYVIKANEGYDSRSAEIIFYDKNSDLKDTLKVVQAQKDAIIISEKNISVTKEGGIVEVKVNTNVDFEVHIPSNTTWISQTNSRSLTEKNILLKILENKGKESRSSSIEISSQDGQLSETIIVTQDGNISVVKLNEAGTLNSLLGEDYLNITSLKVVGPINGDDVCCLRKMLGGSDYNEIDRGKLTILDLSEATIKEGGKWYYKTPDSTNSYNTSYFYTSNNVLGKHIFYGCTNLQTIILPENVTLIEYKALGSCDILKSVTIGNGVNKIDDFAFYYCNALTSITIGNNVTFIGRDAFSFCESLTSVHISDLSAWCKIGFYGFTSNPLYNGAKLYLNDKELTELVIPEDVTRINSYAFYECKTLTKVNIGDKVSSIGISAFHGCTSITSINISDSVKSIGKLAFANCSSLISINIPDGITSMEYGVLWGCSSLTSINIPNSITSIEYGAFSGCSSLTSINVPDSVTFIGEKAFQNCSSMTLLTIGKGVISIYSFAISGCSSLVKCYCYATRPPAIGSFYNFNGDKTTLYVPIGCGWQYKSSNWGDYFSNIKEMDR